MKASNYFMLALVAAFIPLLSCSDSSGGAGADFDSSNYYTKTEVDNLFVTLPSAQYQQLVGTVAGWASRTADGWDVPEGVTAGFFEINVSSTTTPTKPINIEISSYDLTGTEPVPAIQFTPVSNTYTTAHFIAPVTGGMKAYAWHTDAHSGNANLNGITVAVRCHAWIK